MRETWYVCEDGSFADPRETAPDSEGRLVHKDGRKIAYAPHGPRSRGVDVPDSSGKMPFGGKGDHDGDGRIGGAVPAKDMKPEDPPASKPRRGYKTRETKAD